MIEFGDHLHEHFVTPTVIERGAYRAPTAPGAGTEMLAESVREFTWTGAHRTGSARTGSDRAASPAGAGAAAG